MVNPTQIIEQNHALSNPSTTKQIAPALLELESELQAHEDHLAHQFMGRVDASKYAMMGGNYSENNSAAGIAASNVINSTLGPSEGKGA